MGWLWRLFTFLFSRDPAQLAILGVLRTEAQIARLEARLQKRPDDLRARYQVLGYLSQHRFMNPTLAARRVEHALWFLENRPEMEFTGSPFCHVMPQESGYDRVLAVWDRLLANPDASRTVILNAARVFALDDRKRARELLERGEKLEPDSSEWAEHIGTDLLREVSVARMMEDRGEPLPDGPKDPKALSQEALVHFERALRLAKDDERRFHLSAKCAEASLESGRRAEAIRYAEETLAIAPRCGEDRHQPDVIHTAHMVRGLARLEAGDLDGACRDLDDAGRQGSGNAPVLRSFGPDFRLAGLLLDAGRRDAVLSYLARCETFWHPQRVARWRSAIQKGERPRMFKGFDPTEPRNEGVPPWLAKFLPGEKKE
jgi:tetratricopeptide (TPR) repeat protein